MNKLHVPATPGGINSGVEFVSDTLNKLNFKSKDVQEAMLLAEESMIRLIENIPNDMIGNSEIHISVNKKHGMGHITMSAIGAEMKSFIGEIDDIASAEYERSDENSVRTILLRAFEDKIRYARKGKYNFIEIIAGRREREYAKRTIIAYVFALIIGFVLELILKDNAKLILNDYLLSPIETLFINAINFITAPAVFLSIVSAVSQYSSFSDPGRVSIKVFAGYALTSILALLIGVGAFKLLLPGSPGRLSEFVDHIVFSPTNDGETIIKTITGIIPSNFLEPFINTNVLQLVFAAIICGIAIGRIGDYSSPIRIAVNALNTLCTKANEILNIFLPLAVFFSTISLMINIGYKSLVYIGHMLLTVMVALTAMLVIYILIILIIGHLNPMVFLKKYMRRARNTFLGSSSIANVPKTMRLCKNALGISPKVYSFSIPFGAIANMDGNCIYMTIAGLFLARLCGVELFSTQMLPMLFTVFVLSLGSPISSGAVVLCMTVLLNEMGISTIAICLLLGINGFVEMLLAVNDTLGDVAVTLAVARTEDLVDEDVYYAE